MIPLNSYPEAMTKVRVIASKNHLERTFKTLHKVGAFRIDICEEPHPTARTTLGKELYTMNNLLILTDDNPSHIRTIALKNNVKLIHTRPFVEPECHAGKGS